MEIEYEVEFLEEVEATGGCWAECCTYHYNWASNGSY